MKTKDELRKDFEAAYSSGDAICDAMSMARREDGEYEQSLARLCWKWFQEGNAAGEPLASPQLNTATETCGGVPPFFKDIIRKLEFSANQCELWEEPEDVSIVACEYRSLSDKLKNWMADHEAKPTA